jgi:hypothetical protein
LDFLIAVIKDPREKLHHDDSMRAEMANSFSFCEPAHNFEVLATLGGGGGVGRGGGGDACPQAKDSHKLTMRPQDAGLKKHILL